LNRVARGPWDSVPFLTCTHSADRGGIDDHTGPVNLVSRTQPGEQDFMQSAPDASNLPVPQTAPATHAAAAAHLARQQVPAQAGLQDEQDAREQRTIIERLAPWITASPWFGRGQQRFDECPKFVVEYGFSHVLFVVETTKRLQDSSRVNSRIVHFVKGS
jgi:hypothetical protein